ncbi:MAG: Rne/Rng family ribonuclease, partial [Povalibacter sp.]
DQVQIPDGMGAIVRTAGVGRSAEELQWDLDNLKEVWTAISQAGESRPAPFLIYQESKAIIRALRDYLSDEIGEILVDSQEVFNEAQQYMQRFMPATLRKLKLYEDPVPLFTRFQIENQIESAHSHKVNLPSGGSIVIDPTEALVSIDINSARATRGTDIETTALNTNLEAADEIARQLRLRDLGGLIVIDFIDMESQKNQRAVEDRIRDAVKQDRARIQIGRISRFGLLELSRQRLRPSIGEAANITCPRCNGMGSIRGVESLALALLRLIGEEARKDRTIKVIAQLPVEVATYLMNEKREWLNNIETKSGAEVVLVPNKYIDTPAYDIRRVRDDESQFPENIGVSHQIPVAPVPAVQESAVREREVTPTAPAVVTSALPSIPAPPSIAQETATPAPKPEEQIGILVKLWRFFFGGAGQATPPAEQPRPQPQRTSRDSQRRDRPENRHGRDRHGRDRDRPRNESRGERADSKPRGQDNRQHRQDRPERTQQQREPNVEARSEAQRPAQSQPRPQPQPRPEQTDRPEKVEGAPDEGRGERSGRNRRGRRRRGGRGRGEDRGGAPGANQQNGSGESNEQSAAPAEAHQASHEQHSGPTETRAAEPTPRSDAPVQQSQPDSAPSGSAQKNDPHYTVWSSNPAPGNSWSNPGSSSRRDE